VAEEPNPAIDGTHFSAKDRMVFTVLVALAIADASACVLFIVLSTIGR
jgi:hypothetical protein